jgi:nicotinamide-nucleotide amidase
MGDEPTRTDPPGEGRPVVPLENEIVERLTELDWTVSVAESLTAGALSARLCSCPGVEGRVLGGLVSYDTAVKRTVLGVEGPVVSADAAVQMARSVRDLLGTDTGLGVTGVAGPERQEDQPVGTVFVGWCTPTTSGATRLACAGAPDQIRRETAEQALRILHDVLRRS